MKRSGFCVCWFVVLGCGPASVSRSPGAPLASSANTLDFEDVSTQPEADFVVAACSGLERIQVLPVPLVAVDGLRGRRGTGEREVQFVLDTYSSELLDAWPRLTEVLADDDNRDLTVAFRFVAVEHSNEAYNRFVSAAGFECGLNVMLELIASFVRLRTEERRLNEGTISGSTSEVGAFEHLGPLLPVGCERSRVETLARSSHHRDFLLNEERAVSRSGARRESGLVLHERFYAGFWGATADQLSTALRCTND